MALEQRSNGHRAHQPLQMRANVTILRQKHDRPPAYKLDKNNRIILKVSATIASFRAIGWARP